MLTKLRIKNLKKFNDVEIDLGSPVVFIGPNNSGKTTALQALALWNIGLKKWVEIRGIGVGPKQRPGVTINRRDLITIPVPNANLLWRNLHTRDPQRDPKTGKVTGTSNVRIEIIVEGIDSGKAWECGLEFDYANPESLYCRPLRISEDGKIRMEIPEAATKVNIAYLPPMSGLTAQETKLNQGAINVRIGEGRTAEVLRNLSYNVYLQSIENADLSMKWDELVDCISNFFGDIINPPQLIEERGEISMTYLENGIELDITSAGRGLHQTLLLLSYLYSNPFSILLIDEPDAHLEILRQRQMYQTLVDMALEQGSQIIAASHSEVVLNEAATNSTLVAFVGDPHRIDNRSSQVLKALKSIGFDQYYLAEQTRWVLYLEGSTDLLILIEFAKKLKHPVVEYLGRPFVQYVQNLPNKAEEHFYGLQYAVPNLVGIALFDRLRREVESKPNLNMMMWERNEIENYLCFPEVIISYVRGEGQIGLFDAEHGAVMEEIVRENIPPIAYDNKDHVWWKNVKASDDFLDVVFSEYFERVGLPNIMRKSNYHELARLIPAELILPEVSEKLDAILEIAEKASEARAS
ncbi:MAG: AAA family ATPase [Candidatus Bathyarchaeota archaeon]|nr:AAA family ATPase [Candidatus Bathyarchaeota archaeon]